MRLILIIFFIFSFSYADKVKVFTPKKEKITIFYETDGYLIANQKVELKPEVSGIIENIYVKEGEFVKKGQNLLKIRQTQLNFQLQRQKFLVQKQKENVNYLKTLYERKKILYKKELISEDEFLQAKKNYLMAVEELKALNKQLEEIKDQIEKTFVKSPFSGILDKKFIEIGDFVTSNTKLFYIYNPETIILTFYLPQKYINIVNKNKSVEFDLNSKSFTAKIFYISSSLTKNGLIIIKAKPLNFKTHYENVYVKVKFPEKTISGYLIPERAVHMKNSQIFVYTVENNIVRKKQINLITQKYGYIITNTKFKQNEKVIVEAPFDIKEGTKVEITN